MGIKNKLKETIKAETYLFKLMLKINGFFGIIIIFINLIDRFWWGIALPFIDKYLLDELVEIYNNRIIGYTVFLLIGAQLGGKIFSNLLGTIGEILSEYTQNKATLYLDKEVVGLVADMDSSFFDDPANWDASE